MLLLLLLKLLLILVLLLLKLLLLKLLLLLLLLKLHLLLLLLLVDLLMLHLLLLYMLVLRLLLPGLWWALLLVKWRFMGVHLRLEDPGSDGAVLAVQVRLPHLAHRLLRPEPEHLVWCHLHVGLTLLRHLPLLVHHLLQALQEGSWQAFGVFCLPPGQPARLFISYWCQRCEFQDSWRVCKRRHLNHLNVVIKRDLSRGRPVHRV